MSFLAKSPDLRKCAPDGRPLDLSSVSDVAAFGSPPMTEPAHQTLEMRTDPKNVGPTFWT